MKFAVLGNVYLWPGRFVALSPKAYALLLAAGGVWLLAWAGTVWLAARSRLGEAIRRDDDARAATTLAAAGFAFFLGTGAWVTLAYPPTTDEPHYLAITDGLLRGGSLDLAREYGTEAYRAFYPVGGLDAHVVITDEGRWYPQHTLGLPALVLPGFAAAGRWGVLVLLALAAGVLAGALYGLARRCGAAPADALAAAAGLGLTAPLLFGSTLVFSEVPCALLIAAALARLEGEAAPAVLASLLPWLHPRYALPAVGLCVLTSWRRRELRRPLPWRAWTAAALVSGGLFLWVYHGPALVAVLNVLTERYPAHLSDLTAGNLARVSFGNPLNALAAKLLDRDFGVLPSAPWLVLGFAGLAAWRRLGPAARWFLVAGLPGFVLSCLYRNWGGSAYPGRTLVPLLPFAVPFLAAGIAWTRRAPWRHAAFTALLVWSLGAGWALTACPVLRYTSGRTWMAQHVPAAWRLTPFAWFPSFPSWEIPQP